MTRDTIEDKHTAQEPAGYGTYLLTWVTLMVLTAITVVVAGMRLGNFSVLTAVFIATVKGGLVFYFFMHLKYEKPIFKSMVFVALGALSVFIGLTFFDVLFR